LRGSVRWKIAIYGNYSTEEQYENIENKEGDKTKTL
jgi:hypothetical protein